MKPAPFRFVAAGSLEEAVAALSDGGEEAKPIAGGQSLVPAMNMRLVRPSVLVDLNHAGLDGIDADADEVLVGATTRQVALQRSALTHPLLLEALPFVGHVVTRNRGTVGGSIAHADGSAELPLCLLALDGAVIVEGPAGRRRIAADDFFVTHYLTTLQPGELVVETAWPRLREREGTAFAEFALRAGDFALSAVAVTLTRDRGVAKNVRIAVGAAVDRPTLLVDAAAEVEGTETTEEAARAAGVAAAAAIEPGDSIHASAAHVKALTAALVEQALTRAWAAAG